MTLEELRLRDEILQVLYWLKGENLGETATAQQVSVLVGSSPELIGKVFEMMQLEGLLLGAGEATVQLTELGHKEGGRRFNDAFADLTRSAHGACGPDCEDCMINGPENCQHHNRKPEWM
ncbi:hypothetical protein [Meiothermus sp.]|jgi:hypothetical protein|uniref:hypothetical protein n=1 Tax=Meiothermus sp. TaxID=1955249 RepID=UPI00307EC013